MYKIWTYKNITTLLRTVSGTLVQCITWYSHCHSLVRLVKLLNRECLYVYIAFFTGPWRAFYYIWLPGSGNNNSQQRNPYQRMEHPSSRGCFYWPERCNHKVKLLLKGKNNIPSSFTPGSQNRCVYLSYTPRAHIIIAISPSRDTVIHDTWRNRIPHAHKTEPERT